MKKRNSGSITELRKKIDAVDAEIVMLLNKRAGLAGEVGRIKACRGMPVKDFKRERKILEGVRRAGRRGMLGERAISVIYGKIISECRKVQMAGKRG